MIPRLAKEIQCKHGESEGWWPGHGAGRRGGVDGVRMEITGWCPLTANVCPARDLRERGFCLGPLTLWVSAALSSLLRLAASSVTGCLFSFLHSAAFTVPRSGEEPKRRTHILVLVLVIFCEIVCNYRIESLMYLKGMHKLRDTLIPVLGMR